MACSKEARQLEQDTAHFLRDGEETRGRRRKVVITEFEDSDGSAADGQSSSEKEEPEPVAPPEKRARPAQKQKGKATMPAGDRRRRRGAAAAAAMPQTRQRDSESAAAAARIYARHTAEPGIAVGRAAKREWFASVRLVPPAEGGSTPPIELKVGATVSVWSCGCAPLVVIGIARTASTVALDLKFEACAAPVPEPSPPDNRAAIRPVLGTVKTVDVHDVTLVWGGVPLHPMYSDPQVHLTNRRRAETLARKDRADKRQDRPSQSAGGAPPEVVGVCDGPDMATSGGKVAGSVVSCAEGPGLTYTRTVPGQPSWVGQAVGAMMTPIQALCSAMERQHTAAAEEHMRLYSLNESLQCRLQAQQQFFLNQLALQQYEQRQWADRQLLMLQNEHLATLRLAMGRPADEAARLISPLPDVPAPPALFEQVDDMLAGLPSSASGAPAPPEGARGGAVTATPPPPVSGSQLAMSLMPHRPGRAVGRAYGWRSGGGAE